MLHIHDNVCERHTNKLCVFGCMWKKERNRKKKETIKNNENHIISTFQKKKNSDASCSTHIHTRAQLKQRAESNTIVTTTNARVVAQTCSSKVFPLRFLCGICFMLLSSNIFPLCLFDVWVPSRSVQLLDEICSALLLYARVCKSVCKRVSLNEFTLALKTLLAKTPEKI